MRRNHLINSDFSEYSCEVAGRQLLNSPLADGHPIDSRRNKVNSLVGSPTTREGNTIPSETASPRLAVLIDVDNVSAKIAGGLFEEVATVVEVSVLRIYCDFASTRSVSRRRRGVLPGTAVRSYGKPVLRPIKDEMSATYTDKTTRRASGGAGRGTAG